MNLFEWDGKSPIKTTKQDVEFFNTEVAPTLSIPIELTDEGQTFFESLTQIFPNKCPECSYQDTKKTFVRVEDGYRCDSCKYILKASDFYPAVIE